MRQLLLIVILISSIGAQAQYKFPPLRNGGDKILHIAASYTITYHSYQWLEPHLGHKRAKLYSTILALGAGVGKEVIDQAFRKGWDGNDMIANMGGIVLCRIDL